MKLEVGQFVRTNKGIFQIRNKDVFIEDKKQYIGVNGRYTCIDIETIEKASHNIIDLIEVGDYVNGYLIDYIDSERRFLRSERPYRVNSSWYKCLIEKGKDYNMCLHFKEEDIKSIVTKEQMEAMVYKVV